MFFSAVCFSQLSAGEKVPGRPRWPHRGDPGKDPADDADSPVDVLQRVDTKRRNLLAGACTEALLILQMWRLRQDGKHLPQTDSSQTLLFPRTTMTTTTVEIVKAANVFLSVWYVSSAVQSVSHTHCSTFTKAAWRCSKVIVLRTLIQWANPTAYACPYNYTERQGTEVAVNTTWNRG